MENMIETKDVIQSFPIAGGKELVVLKNINIQIPTGKLTMLRGRSGSGKTTLMNLLSALDYPKSGEILFEGQDIRKLNKKDMRQMRQKIQMVFQDPYASLDGRKSVFESIAEPLIVQKVYTQKADLEKRVYELMETAGLAKRLVNSYPHELDGGRRQRVGIARALALNPDFIVLDEPVSALDVSIQAQVLNLMEELQQRFGLTYLFISHDLSVVKHISDQIAVMYLGQIVETASSKELFARPLHPYTQALLSAVPIPSIDYQQERIVLEGDVPSPINPGKGCRFAGRCRYCQGKCRQEAPVLKDQGNGHMAACHFIGK